MWRKTITNLVLFEPLLDELLLALGEHGPAQLQGLVLVQLAALQQDAKVLQKGRGLSRRGGHMLEALDGLGGPQNALREEMQERELQDMKKRCTL